MRPMGQALVARVSYDSLSPTREITAAWATGSAPITGAVRLG